MGSCTWFVAVSGDGLPRENNWREGERVCCCAVWRRTGRRKESYNVGVPTDLWYHLMFVEIICTCTLSL